LKKCSWGEASSVHLRHPNRQNPKRERGKRSILLGLEEKEVGFAKKPIGAGRAVALDKATRPPTHRSKGGTRGP